MGNFTTGVQFPAAMPKKAHASPVKSEHATTRNAASRRGKVKFEGVSTQEGPGLKRIKVKFEGVSTQEGRGKVKFEPGTADHGTAALAQRPEIAPSLKTVKAEPALHGKLALAEPHT